MRELSRPGAGRERRGGGWPSSRENVGASAWLALVFAAMGTIGAGCSSGHGAVSIDGGGTDVVAPPGLTLLRERKLSKLLGNVAEHYEASGVLVRGGRVFVVFDNLPSLASVTPDLLSGSLVTGTGDGSALDQLEGLSDCPGRPSAICAVKETASPDDPRGEVLVLDEGANLQTVLPSDAVFTNPNRGFEGLAAIEGPEGGRFLALCEGNDCLDDVENAGHGLIHVLAESGGSLVTESLLTVPLRARFKDFADIAVRPRGDGTYAVAIVSQMSSALWLGALGPSPWHFLDDGEVWPFPRNASDQIQYCNVEGVAYLDASHVILSSDKSDGSSPCNDKDESLHVFALP